MIKLGDNLGHKKPNIINNIRSKGLKKALISYAFFSRIIIIQKKALGERKMSHSYFSLTFHYLFQACKLMKLVIVSNVALKTL